MTVLTIQSVEGTNEKFNIPEMNINIHEFIEEGENFFNSSHCHYNRTFQDFNEQLDEEEENFQESKQHVIYAPDNIELIKKLVGYKGYNFINITEKSEIDTIWHNKQNNTIELVGGEHHNRMYAISLIRKKIQYYLNGMRKHKIQLPKNLYYFNGNPFFTPSEIVYNNI